MIKERTLNERPSTITQMCLTRREIINPIFVDARGFKIEMEAIKNVEGALSEHENLKKRCN